MSHFLFHIAPSSQASSDVILIDTFHPAWKQAAAYLGNNERFQTHFQKYVESVTRWTRVPLVATFDKEYGLRHVHTDSRNALDLWIEGRDPCYRSHNIHSPAEVAAVVSVMSVYIDHLVFKITDTP